MGMIGWVKIIVGLSVLLWAALLPVYGVQPSIDLFKPYSLVVAAMTTAVIIFDCYLWRLPIIRHFLSKKPLIGGTWRVQIKSDHKDEITNLPINISGFASINQHFSGVWISLFTEDATSKSASTALRKTDGGSFEIISCYQSVPRQQVRERSSIHYGAMLLDTVDDSMMILKGHYWTDRGTRGEIEFTGRVPKVVTSLASAQAVFAPLE